jgi:hypothetical protein
MLAIELGIQLAIARGFSTCHFVICSDNTGVIGSLAALKAFNLEQNRVLQRIVSLMRTYNIWITSHYVASADNLADAPSRGIPATNRPRSETHVAIPPCILQFVTRYYARSPQFLALTTELHVICHWR